MAKQSRLSVLGFAGRNWGARGVEDNEKFVYLSFSGDHFGRPEMLNVINVDLSGFSKGIAALDTACAAPR